ncbi:ATP-dependent zinc metalloprotease FtsH [Dirofilaria immitis]
MRFIWIFSLSLILSLIYSINGFNWTECWIHSHNYDIKNSREMFYKHWINETTYKEEISGIPMIDFTYPEGRRNKFIYEPLKMKGNDKKNVSNSNLIKIPIWFSCMHLALNLIAIACILHATIWWNFTTRSIPSVLLNFCTYDLESCRQRCDKSFNEEYPLVVNNDLAIVINEVNESYKNYLSILEDKREKLKWIILSVCLTYLLLLAISFASTLNSFLQEMNWEKNCGWICTRYQRRLYLVLNLISLTIIILLYLGIYIEHKLISKFNSKLKECRQQLDLCFC